MGWPTAELYLHDSRASFSFLPRHAGSLRLCASCFLNGDAMHRNSRAACEVRGDIWRRAGDSINLPTLMPSNSSLVRRGWHVSARMPSSCLLPPRGPLGNKHDAGDDEAQQDQGRIESADAQPSLRHRLIKEVTQSRAQGSCQDK
ncbi:MAG: hypothetical protein QOF74_4403 [Caballeronia mineralivorans]|nr:hypothetical protein [Caballeronia mineralivorans]